MPNSSMDKSSLILPALDYSHKTPSQGSMKGEMYPSFPAAVSVSSNPSTSSADDTLQTCQITSVGKAKTLKTLLTPVRKAQLTPRMALYIPPHLQKQTQLMAASSTKKAMCLTPIVKFTPEQEKHQKLLYAKFLSRTKSYLLKQHVVMTNKASGSSTGISSELDSYQCSGTKKSQPHLPQCLWTKEMEDLLQVRNSCHEKFMKIGCAVALTKSRKAKRKLRTLLRKARLKVCKPDNVYEAIKKRHEIGMELLQTNDVEFQRDKQSFNRFSSAPSEIRHLEHDELLEPYDDYDASYFMSVSQRHEARLEWSESILEYNSTSAMKRESLHDVKVEIIDSDESEEYTGSDINNQQVISKETEKYNRHSKIPCSSIPDSSPHNSLHSSVINISEESEDATNNEYLNQQFLRRQHDFEREQKYLQIGMESKAREFLQDGHGNCIEDTAFGNNWNVIDKSPYNYSVINFSKSLDASPNCSPVPITPLFPILSDLKLLPEKPIEPFVSERRKRPYSPLASLTHSNTNKFICANKNAKRDYSRLAQKQHMSSPLKHGKWNSDYSAQHPALVSSKKTEMRMSRETSPLIRNYCSYKSSDKPIPHQLSPYSERLKGNENTSSRQVGLNHESLGNEHMARPLSPYSERQRDRKNSGRPLTPFSEHMRQKVDTEMHGGPISKNNTSDKYLHHYGFRERSPLLHTHNYHHDHSYRPVMKTQFRKEIHVKNHQTPLFGDANCRGRSRERYELQRSSERSSFHTSSEFYQKSHNYSTSHSRAKDRKYGEEVNTSQAGAKTNLLRNVDDKRTNKRKAEMHPCHNLKRRRPEQDEHKDYSKPVKRSHH